MAGGTSAHGATEWGKICVLGSRSGKGGAKANDEGDLMVSLAERTEDDGMDTAGLEACFECVGEVVGAIVVGAGNIELFGPALVVAAHGLELAVGGSAVLRGVGRLVPIVIALPVDAEGLYVKDGLHASGT